MYFSVYCGESVAEIKKDVELIFVTFEHTFSTILVIVRKEPILLLNPNCVSFSCEAGYIQLFKHSTKNEYIKGRLEHLPQSRKPVLARREGVLFSWGVPV